MDRITQNILLQEKNEKSAEYVLWNCNVFTEVNIRLNISSLSASNII
jgi:hypothetical protein